MDTTHTIAHPCICAHGHNAHKHAPLHLCTWTQRTHTCTPASVQKNTMHTNTDPCIRTHEHKAHKHAPLHTNTTYKQMCTSVFLHTDTMHMQIRRVDQHHTYIRCINTVYIAGKSQNIPCICTVHMYGSGYPYNYALLHLCIQTSRIHTCTCTAQEHGVHMHAHAHTVTHLHPHKNTACTHTHAHTVTHLHPHENTACTHTHAHTQSRTCTRTGSKSNAMYCRSASGSESSGLSSMAANI